MEVRLGEPDLEERRGDVVLLEHRDELRRVRAGTVVEGERDLPVLRTGDVDVRRVGERLVDRVVLGRLLGGDERAGAGPGERLDPGEVAGAYVRARVHGRRRRAAAGADRDPDHEHEHREHDQRDEATATVMRLDAALGRPTLRRPGARAARLPTQCRDAVVHASSLGA